MAGDDWEGLRAELLEDAETREALERRRAQNEIARKMIALRTSAGLTQKELADKAGITQPEIARIESGRVNPRLATITRIVRAVGGDVQIRVPKGKKLVAV